LTNQKKGLKEFDKRSYLGPKTEKYKY